MHATLTAHPGFTVGPVRRRIFGSFVEHFGRCVYGGIHQPDHPTADEDGFRADVLALVRELGVTTVRYPGGNFVSGYRWEDGVGPVDQRPVRLDGSWRSIETNQVGLGEFSRWAARAGVETMLAVNLGTRGVPEALDLLEYANHPGGTRLSDLRVAHGAPEPYGIRMWCLGNEMDGPWQTGHKTATEYGRLAAETARAMRMLDPGLELVACGSSHSQMPTFGGWESTVLAETYDLVDHVSAHAYYEHRPGDLGGFLASAVDLDRMIEAVVATADAVGARLRSRKRIMVSVDEWNVWYQSRLPDCLPADWTRAPRISEDAYTVADAVVVGNLLISLLRHSDRVAAACQAQLVNTIAPIRAEPDGPAWRQTIFHPFAQAARYARGTVLRTELTAPTYDTEPHGSVPVLDAVVTHDPGAGALTVLAVCREQSRPVRLDLDLAAFPGYELLEHSVLADSETGAANTRDDPDRVRPRSATGSARREGSALSVLLPPVSWNVLRLTGPATGDRVGGDQVHDREEVIR
ncbi:alpha-N-arabinofuranosidase [Micromonospora sp. 067-2]|uniref:arabinosylfuranosidase ArfA n=1 Tax=Micromonospora sp. 067-2 TaxID=2789270 RepID=UPI003978DB02